MSGKVAYTKYGAVLATMFCNHCCTSTMAARAESRSQWADVFCLRAFGALDNLEPGLLVLIQGPVAVAGDGSVMGEDVGGPVIGGDEARRETCMGLPAHVAMSLVNKVGDGCLS